MIYYINLISVTIESFIKNIKEINSYYNQSSISNVTYVFNLEKLNISVESCLSKLNFLKENILFFDLHFMDESSNILLENFNNYLNRLFLNFKKLFNLITNADYHLLNKTLNNESILYIIDYLDFNIEIFLDYLDDILTYKIDDSDYIKEVDYRVDGFTSELYQFFRLHDLKFN